MACPSTQGRGTDPLKSKLLNFMSDPMVHSAFVGSLRRDEHPGPDTETAVAAVLALFRRGAIKKISPKAIIAAMWINRSILDMEVDLSDAVAMYSTDAPGSFGDLHRFATDISSLENKILYHCREQGKSAVLRVSDADLAAALTDLKASARFAPLIAEIEVEASMPPIGQRSVHRPRVSGAGGGAVLATVQLEAPDSPGKQRAHDGGQTASCGSQSQQAKRKREEQEEEAAEERPAAPKRAAVPPSGAAPAPVPAAPAPGVAPANVAPANGHNQGLQQPQVLKDIVNQGPGAQAPKKYNYGPPQGANGQGPGGGAFPAMPQYKQPQYGGGGGGGGGPNAGQQQVPQQNGGGGGGGPNGQQPQQKTYVAAAGGGPNALQQPHGGGGGPYGAQRPQQQPNGGGAGAGPYGGQAPLQPQQPHYTATSGGPNAAQQQIYGAGPHGGPAQAQQPQNFGGTGQQGGAVAGGGGAGGAAAGGVPPNAGHQQHQPPPPPLQQPTWGGPNAAFQTHWQPPQQQQYGQQGGYNTGYQGAAYPQNTQYRQLGGGSGPAPVQRHGGGSGYSGPNPAHARPAGNGTSAPAPIRRAPAAPTCAPPKCTCNGGGVKECKVTKLNNGPYSSYVCQEFPGGCGFIMKVMEWKPGAPRCRCTDGRYAAYSRSKRPYFFCSKPAQLKCGYMVYEDELRGMGGAGAGGAQG